MINRYPDKTLVLLAVLISLAGGCDLAYPETVVVNKLDQRVLVRNLSFNGCLWNTVLAYGEATSPGRCLPGEDRVHFEKFDAGAYCQKQADDGTIEGVCACNTDGQPDDNPMDSGLSNEVPTWFNYQTISSFRAGYIEQDFSVPGPYGH